MSQSGKHDADGPTRPDDPEPAVPALAPDEEARRLVWLVKGGIDEKARFAGYADEHLEGRCALCQAPIGPDAAGELWSSLIADIEDPPTAPPLLDDRLARVDLLGRTMHGQLIEPEQDPVLDAMYGPDGWSVGLHFCGLRCNLLVRLMARAGEALLIVPVPYAKEHTDLVSARAVRTRVRPPIFPERSGPLPGSLAELDAEGIRAQLQSMRLALADLHQRTTVALRRELEFVECDIQDELATLELRCAWCLNPIESELRRVDVRVGGVTLRRELSLLTMVRAGRRFLHGRTRVPFHEMHRGCHEPVVTLSTCGWNCLRAVVYAVKTGISPEQ